MFGKIKHKKNTESNTFNLLFPIPPPPKKEFILMRNLIEDAEKYDNKGHSDIRDSLFDNLILQIEKFKNKSTI